MKLFDEIERKDKDTKSYLESDFAYLNRSARLPIQKIRDVIEEWFSRYPEKEKLSLRNSFRSKKDDLQHSAAFFELFIHELLLRLDCEILEIHPKVAGTNRSPDFLVKGNNNDRFYVEAVINCSNDVFSPYNSYVNILYEAVNTLESPNIFIGMDIISPPTVAPIPRKIKSFLKSRVDEINDGVGEPL